MRPKVSPDEEEISPDVPPVIGVTHGGLKIAEAMALARYSTYTQVYFHPVRRAYDFHLRQFISEHYGEIMSEVDTEEHIALTDVEVLSAIRAAGKDAQVPGHNHAVRILSRQHFRLLKRFHDGNGPGLGEALESALRDEFGSDAIFRDSSSRNSKGMDFPVLMEDGSVENSATVSHVIRNLPSVGYEYIFVDPDKLEPARRWLNEHESGFSDDYLPSERSTT